MNRVPTSFRRTSAWAPLLAAATLLIGGLSFAAAPATKEAIADDGVPRHRNRRPSRAHGRMPIAAFGEPPKYPRGFTHFDYVNPDAPKGGTLYLRNPDRRTSFDKFNPFTLKGNAPAGVMIFMFEPLAVAVRRRAGTDVRPAGRGDAGRARQVVDHVPPASEGALQQRRPGHRRRRQALASTC